MESVSARIWTFPWALEMICLGCVPNSFRAFAQSGDKCNRDGLRKEGRSKEKWRRRERKSVRDLGRHREWLGKYSPGKSSAYSPRPENHHLGDAFFCHLPICFTNVYRAPETNNKVSAD